MKYSILRAAAVSPSLIVADCAYNAGQIVSCIREAHAKGARLVVFPELCITGYTCGDLFAQDSLMKAARNALLRIADETKDLGILSVVGLPLAVDGVRYNVAAFVNKGVVLSIMPKVYIPNYGEFYERRWFSPPLRSVPDSVYLSDDLCEVPFGVNIMLQEKDELLFKVAAEICEDAWTPFSPSVRHALNGASVIANLSASNEVVGKAEYRRKLVSSLSAKEISAYVYCDAGRGESTTDMVFSGHNIIALNGSLLAESALFDDCGKMLLADIDLERIAQDRLRTTTFASCREDFADDSYRTVIFEVDENSFGAGPAAGIGFQSASRQSVDQLGSLLPAVDPHPFVPEGREARSARSLAVIEMQAEGLVKRLSHVGAKGAVVGLSGGLDSTLALLVTCRAFDKLGLDRKGILAVTMPCFGTTSRTKGNAWSLAESTGCTIKEVDIKESVLSHFRDIGQDQETHDVTYENSQARERTQVLMDMANQTGGLVIGTGDLSELALGWCTYNGDQMSMYGVNASIPKSLVRHLVAYLSDEAEGKGEARLAAVLRDILATPVSPELLPPSAGEISQKTEEIVGPYELHDFFLYNVLRWGFSPSKVYFLARMAFSGRAAQDFEGTYTDDMILRWLKVFYRRFFAQQFKRSCMPDGAKVGTVSLSPRGDWRMPSDASAALWLGELETLDGSK
ncbi:MAG: NAD(+) synthase [Treponema sp.]|nr:NAD(+) synthase [Treponema sp.]